jgi:glutaredoxin 2
MLLKILRGSATIPNVTFIAAFDDLKLRKILTRKGQGLSPDFMEKFFPVSVKLAVPEERDLRRIALRAFKAFFADPGWYSKNVKAQGQFDEQFERVWQDGLGRVCTNFRRLKLLLNDVAAAQGAVLFEVDPLDLILFTPCVASSR